jgi:cardiolipin synthase
VSWSSFLTLLSLLDTVLVAWAIVVVLRRPREPRAMLVWILALLLLPFVGLILFVLTGEPKMERTRRRRSRRRKRMRRSLPRAERSGQVRPHPWSERLHPDSIDLMTLATRVSGQEPTTGNEVTIYYEDEQNFNAIMEAVANARHHVHLEYYIFQPDDTGQTLRDLLVKKAAEGVEVRLLVDYIGCWNWPRAFRRSFIKGGVKLKFFLPVVPWHGRWRVNFRNHRKIAVVDGVIGFAGSQNIGDEYRGRLAKYGPWRDTHMRLTGPAVQQLQEIFVEDWHYTTRRELTGEAYFPDPPEAGGQTVQVIASGPDSNAGIMHHLLLSAVAGARKSVAVLTPYFAPDMTMIVALQSAAYRGIRVQLLIPSCSNYLMTLWAGRSFYQELSEAGVEIYEYDRAMLHSKVMIVDDAWAMVGSANMDQRSFRINFEVTTILYDNALADDLRRDFDALLVNAVRIRPTGRDHWSFGESLLLGLARVASPLL